LYLFGDTAAETTSNQSPVDLGWQAVEAMKLGALIVLFVLIGVANLVVVARQARRATWKELLSPSILALVFFALAGAGVVADLRGILKIASAQLSVFITPLSIAGLIWGFLVVLLWRARFFTRGTVAWNLLNILVLIVLVALGSMEPEQSIVTGDHLAVLMALGVTAFFVWFGIRQAVANDERMKAGQKPWEALYAEKVPTWPDLVYIEAICAVIVLGGLVLWGLAVKAPLEAPANPAVTPNPAKAPWYFVGLQELLVYFDASIAGTVLPLLAVIGLLVLPFLDSNPKGCGYYTLRERPVAIAVFLFGFLGLWWYLILVGMFFRGADWAFVRYSPSATEELEVAEAANTLSAIVWEKCLGISLFREADRLPRVYRYVLALGRELPGILLLGAYFLGLPWWLARNLCRQIYEKLGKGKYWFLQLLLLTMLFIPLKMLLRLLCNLSYVLALPEWRLFF
jgi:hypothetical protein